MLKRGVSLLLVCLCFSLFALFASGARVKLDLSSREVTLPNHETEGMAVTIAKAPKKSDEKTQQKREVRQDDPECSENSEKMTVQENAFESPIKKLLWSPYNTDYVWAIEENNGLRMSKNAGAKWEEDFLLDGVTQVFEGYEGDVFYAKMSAGGLKVTRDYVQWDNIESDYPVYNFEVHPTEPLWAAAIFLEGSGCSSTHISSHCTYNLRWTKDGGRNWGNIGSDVFRLTWAGAGSNGVTADSLIFLRSDLVLSRTTSLGYNDGETTYENIMEKCYFLTYLNKVIVGVHVGENRKPEVFESRDDGTSFTYPRLPENVGNVVYLLDGPDGVSYLQVPVDGNLYESSLDGSTYSLLIKNVEFSDDTEKSGFHNINSLIGNFVANVVMEDEEYTLRTMISHEMGSEWFPLSVPQGMSCAENEECTLNLYGEESGFSVFSQTQAAGVIVADGHVGERLEIPPKTIRTQTFLSRDSGQTFEKIADRPHYVGLGDHGGMLVMLDSEETDVMLYSPNQGTDVNTCMFSPKEEVVFDALYSEPTNKGLRFIGVGVRELGDGVEAGITLFMDFSNYFDKACADGDFEPFVPKNMEGEPCLLGQKHTIIRRKRDAECYSPEQYEQDINTDTCQCERDDYLCDYCFEEVDGGLCQRTYENECEDYDPTVPPENCNVTYEVPTGYIKAPRDNCQSSGLDPWDQPPKIKACNGSEIIIDDHDPNYEDDDDGDNSNNIFIIFYVLVAGGVIVIVCYSVPPIRDFFVGVFRRATGGVREQDDELFGEKYKTVDSANAVSLLDSDEEAGGKGDDDDFLFGGEAGEEENNKEDDLFGDFGDGDAKEEGDPAGLI